MVTYSTVPSSYVTAYSANKPLFLAKSVLAGHGADVTGGLGPETISACWRYKSSVTTSPLSVTDAKNSDNVTSPLLACDRQLTGASAPAWSQNAYAHALIFAAEVGATDAVDSIVIANHSFGHTAGVGGDSIVVKVAVSGSNTFPPGDTYIVQEWASPFTHERLVSLDLGNAFGASGAHWSYTEVNFVQVLVYSASKIVGPQIGEVFAGPRRQLSRTPSFDTSSTESTNNVVGTFTSKSGVETRYGMSLGQEEQIPKFHSTGGAAEQAWYNQQARAASTDLYLLDDMATLNAFWKDTSYGTHPFFFMPNTPGKEAECFFMYADTMEFPSVIQGGLADREVDFAFREISPYYSSEV